MKLCFLRGSAIKRWLEIHEIKQNRFCMECFTAGFLGVFQKKHQNLAFGYLARYSPSNSGIPTTFFKFSNFLRS